MSGPGGTCISCGLHVSARPLTWSLEVYPAGSGVDREPWRCERRRCERWRCELCTRNELRAIEARLDEGPW